jgi:hypothetical protein
MSVVMNASRAVEEAISEAFSNSGQLVTPSDIGLHLNFAAEPQNVQRGRRGADEAR